MGLEMAIARLGVFAVLSASPRLADKFGNVEAPILFCVILLMIGLINFIVFSIMDAKFDRQMGVTSGGDSEEEFKVSDLGKIISSKMFWFVALLCVLYYSAIFPFQRYATNFLEVTLQIPAAEAADLFRWFPILAMVLTPFLGAFLDNKGKGATMLMIGAIIMIACHLSFAFLLPAFPSKGLALLLVVVLGVSFSLVPAALWPSVPKIIDPVILGSAYSLIFWIIATTLINPNALKLMLPKSSNQLKDKAITTVSIQQNGSAYNYYVELEQVKGIEGVERALQARLEGQEDPTISLHCDKTVAIDEVVKVMNVAKDNNYKLILATQP